jgi:hypothetical protein
MLPRLAQTTTPRPMASGPPQLRNLSLGAQAATVDRPPTMPAVYHAARVRIGPPQIVVTFHIMYRYNSEKRSSLNIRKVKGTGSGLTALCSSSRLNELTVPYIDAEVTGILQRITTKKMPDTQL